jgi:hypothetical protein
MLSSVKKKGRHAKELAFVLWLVPRISKILFLWVKIHDKLVEPGYIVQTLYLEKPSKRRPFLVICFIFVLDRLAKILKNI